MSSSSSTNWLSASTRELLALQSRVIAALVLRETRATFGTSNFGYAWAIITPTASVGLLVLIFSLIGRQPPFGASLALFFATGILTLQFYNELSGKLMTVFNANRALLTYPIIKDVDTLLARALLICLTFLTIMFVFYSALIMLGLAHYPAHIDQLILAFLACSAIGIGMGTLNAVISSLWESWTQVEKVLTRPLFFISGVFYVPSQLPAEAIAVLKWNPILHVIEWMREGFYSNYNSLVLDTQYLLIVTAALLLLGFCGERLYRKQRF